MAREEGDRLRLDLDKPKQGDLVISHNDQNVIIIDPGFESRIRAALIDVEDTVDGHELIMRSAKEKQG